MVRKSVKKSLLLSISLFLLLLPMVNALKISNNNIDYIIPNNVSYYFIADSIIVNKSLKLFFLPSGGKLLINISDEFNKISISSSVEQEVKYDIIKDSNKVLLSSNGTIFINKLSVNIKPLTYDLVVQKQNNVKSINNSNDWFNKKLFYVVIPIFDFEQSVVNKKLVVVDYKILFIIIISFLSIILFLKGVKKWLNKY